MEQSNYGFDELESVALGELLELELEIHHVLFAGPVPGGARVQPKAASLV